MAYTALVATQLTDAGVDPASHLTAALAAGHTINPGEILQVHNGAGAPINVTLTTGGTLGGKAVADTVVAVPAGHDIWIAGLRADIYAQPDNATYPEKVLVDYSSVTTVTVAAYKL